MSSTQMIVTRIADMRRRPDQDETRVCARCGERVAIYPSGQAMLALHPELQIVCNRCVVRT